jgi:diacylglycerol kinase (ATP)
LPIGTGNDLSRVLKWGGSHKGTKLKSFISKIEKACVVLLDKWDLTYTSDVVLPHENHVMHNYFSIGSDANIALQFHEMRQAHPEKFSSRTQNLAWYVRLGLQNFSTELLSPHVSVEINGSKVELPESTRCVVVLNLPSYSGGGNPWGTKKSRHKSYANPAIDDGLIEVVAVNGPLQLVCLKSRIFLPFCSANIYS